VLIFARVLEINHIANPILKLRVSTIVLRNVLNNSQLFSVNQILLALAYVVTIFISLLTIYLSVTPLVISQILFKINLLEVHSFVHFASSMYRGKIKAV